MSGVRVAARRVWGVCQRPVVWHNPSVRVFVVLAVLAVGVAVARSVAGLVTDSRASVLVGVVSAVVLWLVARSGQRLSFAELGVTRASSGLAWGGGFAALVVLAAVAAVSVGQVRLQVKLSAPSEFSSQLWLFAAFVSVPLATVLFEELFFRGVLWAYLARIFSPLRVLLVSSVLFALWHVPPLLVSGQAAGGQLPLLAQVLLTLVVTFAGGLVFGFLRLRSGSVLAPVIAHVATNSVGFVVLVLAWSPLPVLL